MKSLKPTFGWDVIGLILLTQTFLLALHRIRKADMVDVEGRWQRRLSVSRFKKELELQGVPEELIKQMAKRYGKVASWTDVFKLRSGL